MTSFFRVAFAIFFTISLMAKPLTLPIVKSVGPLVITEIEVNGHKLKFLIDSGSNASFIDSSALGKLKGNLTRDPKSDTYVNTFGGKKKSDAYKFNLSLGGFEFKDLPAFVMNTKKFTEKSDGINCCDGILGIDFIKDQPFEVDIENKVIKIHEQIKKKKGWKKLPVKLEGKNVITFSCSSEKLKKLKLRLDSGSEAPLIFHRAAVDKFKLREQTFLQGYAGGGLPFISVPKIKCGQVEVDSLISTFFYGVEGALTHKFVDGNAGAHLLGSRYIFNLKKNEILVKNKPIPFKIGSKLYNFKSDFKFNEGHFSVVHQAQALIIKSCSEAYTFQDCMKKLCELEGKKLCVFKESGNVIQDFIHSLYPVKSSDCSIGRLTQELRTRPVRYNYCWYKLGEINEKVYPGKFKEVDLGKDFKKYEHRISAQIVTNPFELTRDFYCYSIYQNVISQKSLPASMYGLSVKGLSLSKKYMSEYKTWLSTKEGASCQAHVSSSLGEKASSNLEKYFKKEFLILVNPFTLLGDGLKEWDFVVRETLNHEILHSVYAISPKYQKWAKKAWAGLDEMQQESFKKAHPSYDFKNVNTLYKEYFSYHFENDPSLLEVIK